MKFSHTIILLLLLITTPALQAQNNAEQWYHQGINNYNNDQIQEAIFCFDKAITMEYTSLEYVYYYRGLANQSLLKHKEAIADFGHAIQNSPSFQALYHAKSNSCISIGDYQQALDNWDALALINPSAVPSIQYAYISDLQKGTVNQLNAQEWFDKRVDGNYYDKVFCISQAIRLNYSPLKNAYFERAQLYYHQWRNSKGALVDVNKAIELGLRNAEVYNLKGKILYVLNNYDEAINLFDKALDLKPNMHNFIFNRANVKSQISDYDGAIKDYTQAIALSPKNANYYYVRAYAYGDVGKYELAINDFTKAIALEPDDYDLYYDRAELYLAFEQYDKALADFTICYKNCTDYCYIDINAQGYCYFLLEEYDLAIKKWDEMEKLAPEDFDAEYDYIQEARQKLSIKKEKEKELEPSPPTPSHQTKRLALLIGNANYGGNSSLKNPINDATDIEIALQDFDFETTLATNLNLQEIEQKVADFSAKIEKHKQQGFHVTVLVYFSGHGLQHSNINYLIPIDFNVSSAIDIPYKAYSDQRLLDHLSEAHTQIVMIDACRNKLKLRGNFKNLPNFDEGLLNPNIHTIKKIDIEKFKNLSRGTLVSFAAAPGTKALDGNGRNSPYVESFLKIIRLDSKLEIRDLFREVKNDLYDRTNGQQQSWTSDGLIKYFYFVEE